MNQPPCPRRAGEVDQATRWRGGPPAGSIAAQEGSAMGASEDHQSSSGGERRRKYDGDSKTYGDGDRDGQGKRRREVEEREGGEKCCSQQSEEERDKKRRRHEKDEERWGSRNDKDEERRRSRYSKDEERRRSRDSKNEERRGSRNDKDEERRRSRDSKDEERRGSRNDKDEERRNRDSKDEERRRSRDSKDEERRGRSSHRDETAHRKGKGWEKPRGSVCSNEEKGEVGIPKRNEKKRSGWDVVDLPQVHVSAPTSPLPTPLAPVSAPASGDQLISPYLMLHNVFDPSVEKEKEFYLAVQDDLHTECSRNALVVHDSRLILKTGSICFRFDSEVTAIKARERFQGREIDGRELSCSYLLKETYVKKFGYGHNF